jgi:hypothetical protein
MLFTSFVGANTVNGPFSSNWSPISAILMSCISSEKRLSEANTSSNLPAGGVKTCSYRNRYVIIRNQRKVCLKKASGFHQQSRNCKPLGTHEFTPMFHAIRGAQSLVVCVLLCRSLFVLLSFSFWPLYCLFVDLQLLITALPWASWNVTIVN